MGRADRRRWLRRWLAPILLAVAPAITSGCLDFDEEEVHVAFDAEHDRLDAQLVYRGLYSAGTSGWSLFGTSPVTEDVEGTEKQLDQLLAGRPIFALFDGMALFDLVELRESEDPQAAALAKLVSVDRGGLFKSADGRIDAWQHLRIRDVTRFLEIWDGKLRVMLANDSDGKKLRGLLGCDDAVSLALWCDAIAKEKRWVERSGPEVLWHVPASATAAKRLATRIESAPALETLLDVASKPEDRSAADPASSSVQRTADLRPSDDVAFVAWLKFMGVTVKLREGGADLVLCDAARAPQTVHIKKRVAQERHYDLAPYLEKRRVTLRTDVDDAVLSADFAERRK